MNRTQRQQIATVNMRKIKAFEDKYMPKVEKALHETVSSLITVLKESGYQAGIGYLNKTHVNHPLPAVINDLYKEVGLFFYKQTIKRFEKKSVISEILAYLSAHFLDKITFKVQQTLSSLLLNVLNKNIENGLGIDETVRMLDESGLTKMQAARIVRTEINRAVNTAAEKAGNDSDFEMVKEWIAIKDARTRGNPVHGAKDTADHWHMDGMVVDVNQSFYDSRSNTFLKHPGDPEAGPQDTINCRCQLGVYAKRDANGRMIPKKSKVYIDRNFSQNRQTITI